MPHPMMTACGLSSLHRYKFKKVIGKLRGGSAQRKGAGMHLPPTPKLPMRAAVMPAHIPKRTLQFR